MSYYAHSMATLAKCQRHYDNLAPPDPDEIPAGCREDDYEPEDDEDEPADL